MSKQVKLLIFSDWFVPGYKAGGPIRSITNFCLSMAKYLDIYVFTSDRDLGDDQAYKGILFFHPSAGSDALLNALQKHTATPQLSNEL
ncbi:MAG: hypothetical protein AAFR66_20670 [Bacteroidota bacterium]